MKKLIVLLLTVMFVISGCSKESTEEAAIKAYINAANNMKNMKSANYALDVQVKGATNQQPQNLSFHLDGAYKADTSNIEVSASVDMKQEETSMDNIVSLYVKDQNLYLNLMNMQKTKSSLASYMELLKDVNLTTDDSSTNTTDVEKIKPFLKETKKENDKITFTLDPVKVKEYLKKQAEEKNVSETDAIDQVTFDTLTFTTTIKDNFMHDGQLHVIAKNPDNEDEYIDVTLSFSFSDINKVNSISYPTDLDTYVEADEDALTNLL